MERFRFQGQGFIPNLSSVLVLKTTGAERLLNRATCPWMVPVQVAGDTMTALTFGLPWFLRFGLPRHRQLLLHPIGRVTSASTLISPLANVTIRLLANWASMSYQ